MQKPEAFGAEYLDAVEAGIVSGSGVTWTAIHLPPMLPATGR